MVLVIYSRHKNRYLLTHSLTHTRAHSLTHSLTHTHAHMHARTETYTHTHIQLDALFKNSVRDWVHMFKSRVQPSLGMNYRGLFHVQVR